MEQRYHHIYDEEAARYERLIAREDAEGNLWRTLRRLHPLTGAIVEMGAGTGRLTRELARTAERLWAFDGAAGMLEEARRILEGLGRAEGVTLQVADHRDLPLPDGVADLVIEGWAFGHLMHQGLEAAEAALSEAGRVLKPGGVMILIETLGTGRETPEPPSPRLTQLYAHLETHGFTRHWCRTDYRFEDPAEAETLTRFFFGDGMVARLDGVNLPECTGLWTRTHEA